MNFRFICDKLLLDDDVDPKSDNFSLNVDSKCWNYVYFKLICCCCCINTSITHKVQSKEFLFQTVY